MNDFILKGNICYSETPKNLRILENSYLVCCDGKSQGIYPVIPKKYQALPCTDYTDQLILPGLVDLHIHAPQYAFRGTGMDLELMDWLAAYTFPEEEKYADLPYAKKAYEIFVDQLRKGATTRASIFATKHVPATELLMEMLETSGLYTYVGKVNMDRGAPGELLDAAADTSAFETFGWINRMADKYKRTKPILTPRFIPCCSDALLEELRQVQMTYHLPVQSHLSENPDEVAYVRELRPDIHFYGEGYDVFGLFGYDQEGKWPYPTIMAHCIYSGKEEMQRILENGVYVAHCPTSNMNLSSGIAPVRKYLEMGIHVGLGTDIAGGHSASIFRAMTDAIGVSKLYWRLIDSNCKPLTFEEAFYLGTKGGGAFFGKTGSFEKGYEFDAIVLDDSHLRSPEKQTVRQRLERFAYLSGETEGITAKYAGGLDIGTKRIIRR